MIYFPTEYEFIPKLRVRIVTDDERIITGAWIGPMFADWMKTLPDAESTRIFRRDWLTKKQTKSFWQYLGRTDNMPGRVQIQILDDGTLR